MPDYSKREYDERREAALIRKDALKAQERAFEREMHGTFAEGMAARRGLEGDFRQKANLQRELQGTFADRAAHDVNFHGTFAGKEAGLDRRLGMQGDQAMEQLMFREGPGSLEERKYQQLGDWQRGQLGLEGRRLGIMESENTLKGKAAALSAMGEAQKNAADLFPEDPAAAEQFYRKELKRIGALFPGIMPNVEEAETGRALATGSTAGAPAPATQPVNVAERYRQSMASRNFDPMAKFSTPAPAATLPTHGPTGDLFQAGRPRPPVTPRPPLSPDLEFFPGGPRNPGVIPDNSSAVRRPMPLPGRIIQPVPTAMAGARPSVIRRMIPGTAGIPQNISDDDIYTRRSVLPYGK